MANVLTQRKWMLWVQPDGPNTPVYPLGCHDAGDLTIPEMDVANLKCWKPDRSGWDVVGEMLTPPDDPSFDVTFRINSVRDFLEKVRCPFGLYLTAVDCGPVNEFSNYVRGQAMAGVRRTERTYSNTAHHEEDNETTLATPFKMRAVYDMDALTVSRETTISALAANDIAGNADQQCEGDCGETIDLGERLVAGGDSAVGPATADVLFSNDFGETWAAGATDPFGAGFHVMAVARVNVGRTTTRIIAGREGTGAVQGQMAYSDDDGATWTVVSVGGAAAGHGPTFGHGISALDRFNIHMASHGGYIYKSVDGGVTWAATEAGVIHAGDNHFVHFADKTYGFAGGAAGVTSISNDGGASWFAGGIPAASPARCGWRLDRNRLWVGLDNGALYYSTNGGVTWALRAGLPAGALRSMWWCNEYQGYLLHNTGGPVGTVYHTNNGGYTWEALTTPANNGLNSIWMASPYLGYVVGEVVGAATAAILKIQRA